MNADHLSELELIAVSAVVDDDATAEERALVETSPELVEMVSELRSLRTRTTALVEVDDGETAPHRESAIGAALALFDDLHATRPVVAAAAVSGADVIRFERRRRQYRWVGGAAAAMVFVFGGVALLQGNSANDRVDVAVPATDADGSAKVAPAETEAAALEAPEAGATEMAPAGTEAPADSAAPMVADEPTGGAAPEPPIVDDVAQLRAYAEVAFATGPSEVDDELPTTSTSACIDETLEFLGDVRSGGVDALVVRAVDDGELRVLDAAGCAVLLTAAP